MLKLKWFLAMLVTVIVLFSQVGLSTHVYAITRPIELPISDQPPVNQGVVEISTPIQLLYVSWYQELYRDNNLKLMNSLNMSNLPWIPIDHFTGTFDGNNYDISNVIIHQPVNDSSVYWGMFAQTESSAIIKNMTLTNFTVDGEAAMGTLVGYNKGKIKNVGIIGGKVERVRLNQSITTLFQGGLVGENDDYGKIDNVYSTCKVSSFTTPSGLVGGIAGLTIYLNHAYAAGAVATNEVKFDNGLSGFGFELQSYYDREITGTRLSTGSAPSPARSTQDMLKQSNFVGWDFQNTWSIIPDTTYPFLKQMHSVTPEVLSPAFQNSVYSQKLQIPTSTYTPNDLIWQAISLPPGLSLSNDGTLTGTPTSIGDQSFTVAVYSPSTHIVYGSGTISLLINPDPKSNAPTVNDIDIINNLAPTGDTVTVKALNAGDVIKVYDLPTGGNLLGQSPSVASGQTSATVTIAQLGTGAGQVYVSITRSGKLESARTAKPYDAESIVQPPITYYHISGLSVDQGTLSPAFSPSNLNYTVNVANAVSSLDLDITKADPKAAITVTGASYISVTGNVYTYRVNLSVGSNSIQIAVTAQDGTMMNPYQLTVNRASSNANLSGVALSNGALNPAFASGITVYDSSVANDVSSLTVTAHAADSGATLKVNGTTVLSGAASGPINLNVGNNMITVEVTAQDGTKKSYHISVNRAEAMPTPTLSTNANLKTLQLSGAPLGFLAGTTNYSISVGNSVSGVTLSAAAEDAKATVTINSEAATTKQISLNEGSNSVLVEVTAEDGITKKTYSLTIKRAVAQTATANKPIQVNTAPVAITVPAGITDAAIQVPTITSGGTKQATLPLVEAKVSTTLGDVTVLIADGTHITAPSNWDGVMKLPQVQSNSSVTISNGNVNSVIEVGSADVTLTFDKAVRIVLPNQAGKLAGYVRDGTFTAITNTITADTQTAADHEIAAGGDAKMDVGSDLVIWTKHFDKFVSYVPANDSNRHSRRSGSGGGAVAAATDTIFAVHGGTVNRHGVTIVVPAGAMNSDIKVTVDKVTDSPGLHVDPSLKLISDVFEINKDVPGEFSEAVSITLPFDISGIDIDTYAIGVYWLNEETGKWILLDSSQADKDKATVTGSVNHFAKFAVLAALKPVAVPSSTIGEISDIKGHWAEKSIRDLIQLGAIDGYPDGTFKPENHITRAEFVSVIVKAFHLEGQDGKVFTDTANHWAKNAVATAAARGVITGYSDSTFGPDDLITREQMAVIIVGATQMASAANGKSFTDSAGISEWAKDGLVTATSKGLMDGYQDGTLKPKGNTKRTEAVTVIQRALALKK